jgi:hypothetical protein
MGVSRERELAAERVVVGSLYDRLDELRARAREDLKRAQHGQTAGTPAALTEQDAFVRLYAERLQALDAATGLEHAMPVLDTPAQGVPAQALLRLFMGGYLLRAQQKPLQWLVVVWLHLLLHVHHPHCRRQAVLEVLRRSQLNLLIAQSHLRRALAMTVTCFLFALFGASTLTWHHDL